jgi:hypothetical protein
LVRTHSAAVPTHSTADTTAIALKNRRFTIAVSYRAMRRQAGRAFADESGDTPARRLRRPFPAGMHRRCRGPDNRRIKDVNGSRCLESRLTRVGLHSRLISALSSVL